jgi:hypothetical protein
LERLLGSIYLKKAISSHGLENIQAVETRFFVKQTADNNFYVDIKCPNEHPLENIFTIDSKGFITFSRYMGDTKPKTLWGQNLNKTGFHDFAFFANLRLVDDTIITVIDTEYSSFKNDEVVSCPSEESMRELGGQQLTFTREEIFL